MAGASEWEKEVYTTIQLRRYDKTRLVNHSFVREPSWRTVARLLDIIDMTVNIIIHPSSTNIIEIKIILSILKSSHNYKLLYLAKMHACKFRVPFQA